MANQNNLGVNLYNAPPWPFERSATDQRLQQTWCPRCRDKLIPQVRENFATGFQGLVKPRNMLACNSAQVLALNKNCHECTAAATTCAADPQGDSCSNALGKCDTSPCQHPIVKDLIRETCGSIHRPHNYVKL